MKVLHLLQSSSFSGAENVVCQIIDMSKTQNDLEMFYCSRDGQISEILREKNINFIPVNSLTVDEVKKVIDKINPDIIHAHDRTASYIAAKSTDLPIVVHMHVNNNKGLKLFFKNIIWLSKRKHFSHIFWVSNSSFSSFPFKKLVKRKSSILYNVINSEEVIKKASLTSINEHYDVCYVGRLTFQKNPERLMEICSKISNKNNSIKIAIIGNGDMSNYVEEYIRKNNISNISYLGYKNNPLCYLKNSKVMVLTSRFEGTPMVAIEAQILGIPIVSTPVDGMLDIIDDGKNGFLISDNSLFVEKVLDLVENSELNKNFSNYSKEKIKKFTDIESFFESILNVYKRFI